MTTIKSYNVEALTDFQKNAISCPGSDMQQSILNAALSITDADEYISWFEQKLQDQLAIDTEIITEGAEPNLPTVPLKYTPQEFKEFPAIPAEQIWETWKDINPGLFCSSGVWAYIVTRFIQQDKIKPFYLMVGKDNGKSDGKKEIESAIEKKDDKKIDTCTRSFLRRLSGLQAARGARSVYQDCPPAVAWWQHYIAHDVAQNIDCSKDDILKMFRAQKRLWEILTDKMASQLTVIGDINIRDGVILFYLNYGYDNPHIFQKPNINKALNALGVMSAWRALGIFSPTELCEIIYNDIYPELPRDTSENASNE